MDFYFRQFWQDHRLKYDRNKLGKDKLVLLDRDSVQKFWRPDTFFVNEKKMARRGRTAEETFLRIKPDGEVLFSQRFTAKFSCPMDLQWFPYDAQLCYLEIESCEHKIIVLIMIVTLALSPDIPTQSVAPWRTSGTSSTTA